jgi:hypothetical protein
MSKKLEKLKMINAALKQVLDKLETKMFINNISNTIIATDKSSIVINPK